MDPSPKRQKPSGEHDLLDLIKALKEEYSLYYKTINGKDFLFSRNDSLHSDDENYNFYTKLLEDTKSFLQQSTSFYKAQYEANINLGSGMQSPFLLKDIDKKSLITQFEGWRSANQALQAEIQEILNPPPISPIPTIYRVPEDTRVPGTPTERLPRYPPAANIEAYFLPYEEKKEKMEMEMAKYELRLKRYAKLFKRYPAVASFVSKELDNLLETRFNKLNEILKATKDMTIEKLRNSDERVAQFVLQKLEDPKSMQMKL